MKPYPSCCCTSWKTILVGVLVLLMPSLLWAKAGDISTVAGTGLAGYNSDGIAATSAYINYPYGVGLDNQGNMYIADAYNHRIRKVDAITSTITTIAGTGTAGYNGDGGIATNAQLNAPTSTAFDNQGNLYITDTYNHRIRRVDAVTHTATTVAGTGTAGYNGEGGAATSAQLNSPYGVVVDSQGNLYIADSYNHRVRKVDAITQTISTVAGTGEDSYSGDGGVATSAKLHTPTHVELDTQGNLYITDYYNHRIRRVDAITHTIITVAGAGTPGYSGDGSAATSAQLNYPSSAVLDSQGNLYIADQDNHRIRRVNAVTHTISTVAGMGTGGYSGDGGAATSAQLKFPTKVALDSQDNLYIADNDNHRIRRVEAAKPQPSNHPTNFTATANSSSQITTTWMDAIGATQPDGYLVICRNSNSFTAPTDGTAQTDDSNCADGAGVKNIPQGTQTAMWTGLNAGTQYYFKVFPYSNSGSNVDYKTDSTPVTGNMVTAKPSQTITFTQLAIQTFTPSGTINLAASSSSGLPVSFSSSTPSVCTVNGSTVTMLTAGVCGIDANQAGNASYDTAPMVHQDIYLGKAEPNNHPESFNAEATAGKDSHITTTWVDAVGTILPDGYIVMCNTIGSFTPPMDGTPQTDDSNCGDGAGVQNIPQGRQMAEWAELSRGTTHYFKIFPYTNAGNSINNYKTNGAPRIASATPISIFSTVAGNGTDGYNSDGILATDAQLNNPQKVKVDKEGNLYIADTENHRIRRVDAVTHNITTIAGTGTGGYNGDDIPATSAQLNRPYDVAVDSQGNLYIADADNHRIRRIDAVTQTITTVAGTSTSGSSGDGGIATAATLKWPVSLVLDKQENNLYFADSGNQRIRRIDVNTQVISTVAGSGHTGLGGDGMTATNDLVLFRNPTGIALDSQGNLYIADMFNHRIRRVDAVTQIISTVAGGANAGIMGAGGYSGDGNYATAAQLFNPSDVAVDNQGNLYIADSANNRIRRVDAVTHIITTLVGNHVDGLYIDIPSGVTLDSQGYLYFTNTSYSTILRMGALPAIQPQPSNHPTGFSATANSASRITTAWTDATGAIPPNGYTVMCSTTGDFTAPTDGIANNNDTHCADGTGLQNIPQSRQTALWSGLNAGVQYYFKVFPYSNVASNIDYKTEGTPPEASATTAKLEQTITFTNLLRAKVNGIPFTLSATGGTSGQPIIFTSKTSDVCSVAADGTVTSHREGKCTMTADQAGNSSYTAAAQVTVEIDITDGKAEPSSQPTALVATVNSNFQITTAWRDAQGVILPDRYLLMCSTSDSVVAPADGAVLTDDNNCADGSGVQNVPVGTQTAVWAGLNAGVQYYFKVFPYTNPNKAIIDYKTDGTPPTATATSTPALISTVAGNGTPGYNGDGMLATDASLHSPSSGIAVDSQGNLYFSDVNNDRVRRVDAITHAISTVAGTGTRGYNGDGIAATSAQLKSLRSVALDSQGNLYIADQYNHRIRRVDAVTHVITTVAGTGVAGYNDDGIIADSAQLNEPWALAFDSQGNLYIADAANDRIRRVDAVTHLITTVAGTGVAGYNGDGIAASSAQLNHPEGVALDNQGNLYIGDLYNHRIRRVDAITHTISTVAGTDVTGYNGDGIPANSAQLNTPSSVLVDNQGNLYFSDIHNHRIRRVDAITHTITTVAGTGVAGYNGDGIAASSAQLNGGNGVGMDSQGNLYIADFSNDRVRKVTLSTLANTQPSSHPTGVTATANSGSQITLAWTDATGAIVPNGYLVMCSTSDSVTAPTDGTAQADDADCADGLGVKNIGQGIQTTAWAGLNSKTQYFFTIYPYSGSGVSVNYKTDANPPSTNAKTASGIDTDADADGIDNDMDTDDDNDGLPDTWENHYGFDSLDATDATLDADNDGLSNAEEYRYTSNPTKPDSDGDGVTDKQEINTGRNPTVNEGVVIQIINGLL